MKPSSSGAGSQPRREKQIADEGEERHQVEIERPMRRGCRRRCRRAAAAPERRRDRARVSRRRHRPASGRFSASSATPADPHRRDQSPEEARLAGHHLRAGMDALDRHRADQERHCGVRRNAEGEHRNERGLGGRPARRFRPGHAFDRALAERNARLGSDASSRSHTRPTTRAARRRPEAGRAPRRAPCRAGSRATPRGRRAASATRCTQPGLPSSRRPAPRPRWAMISPAPNTPIAITARPIPPSSCGRSKPKRGVCETGSVFTWARRSPSSVIATLLRNEPEASAAAPTSPSTINEKYSAGPNWKASSASGSASTAMTSTPSEPAMNAPSAAARARRRLGPGAPSGRHRRRWRHPSNRRGLEQDRRTSRHRTARRSRRRPARRAPASASRPSIAGSSKAMAATGADRRAARRRRCRASRRAMRRAGYARLSATSPSRCRCRAGDPCGDVGSALIRASCGHSGRPEPQRRRA